MENPNRFYTYAYLREDGTPYYIGKGKGNRAYVKRYGRGRARRPKNLNNIILLKQNLTEYDAFKHEIYMIAVLGRKDLGDGILHNRTNGGDGPYGHIPWNKGATLTEDVKKKISINRKGIASHRPGFKHNEETKQLLSQKSLGKKHTQETREKMSKSRMGHYVSTETTAKIVKKLCKGPYKLSHISGKMIIVNNFSQFCKNNNLHYARMMDRITGKVKKPYKGWTGQVLTSVL